VCVSGPRSGRVPPGLIRHSQSVVGLEILGGNLPGCHNDETLATLRESSVLETHDLPADRVAA
jgi:hypothetical protein